LNIDKGWRIEKKHSVKCSYPGCEIYFDKIRRGRYCPEHRKKSYHKGLYFDKYAIQTEKNLKENNMVFQHGFKYPTTCLFRCSLEKCTNIFKLVISPDTKIYPKFCKCHRNEFKRKLFVNKNYDK